MRSDGASSWRGLGHEGLEVYADAPIWRRAATAS